MQNIDFGRDSRPEQKVLQSWKACGIPVEFMRILNANGLGNATTYFIYYDIDDKPTPLVLLKAMCGTVVKDQNWDALT